MRFILYLAFICLLTSCKSSQKTIASTTAPSVASTAEGLSIEKAVKVKSINEEYQWAKAQCPGCQFMGQALMFVKEKPYDALTFKASDGTEKKFYFDISSFFGKF